MINKKVLSEIALYCGTVKMPEGFEIEKEELTKNIFLSQYYENFEYHFSITFDKLKNFITDFIKVEHNLNLVPKKIYGNFYEKNEISKPKLEVDPVDLRNSCDFVFLYGAEIDSETCEVVVYYDDNRRKGRSWNINLKTNEFVMFPSSQLFYIKNNNNSHLNFVQTIHFEYI